MFLVNDIVILIVLSKDIVILIVLSKDIVILIVFFTPSFEKKLSSYFIFLHIFNVKKKKMRFLPLPPILTTSQDLAEPLVNLLLVIIFFLNF